MTIHLGRFWVTCDGAPGRQYHASTTVEAIDLATANVALVRIGWRVLGDEYLCPACALHTDAVAAGDVAALS